MKWEIRYLTKIHENDKKYLHLNCPLTEMFPLKNVLHKTQKEVVSYTKIDTIKINVGRCNNSLISGPKRQNKMKIISCSLKTKIDDRQELPNFEVI